MIRAGLAAFWIGLNMSSVAVAEPTYQMLSFSDLKGWDSDDHDAALKVFQNTCVDIDRPEWQNLCALATSQPNGKTFFELFFRPVVVNSEETALFTGYYEPELNGSRYPTSTYRFPLYKLPPEVKPGQLWRSRRDIEESGILEGRGLEIAYIDDPVDVFFLQVQGSGRVKLAEGGSLRVGYAGKNGHTYRSIGQELVRRGVYSRHQVSAQVIKRWVRRNPIDGAELLKHNGSYVFFRELRELAADLGPLGAMNRSITTLRSVAIDPQYVPLGAPVWIEKEGIDPLNRLMIAQDTGSAIKGAQRADIFYGTGEVAGRTAGRIKDAGRLVVLLPIEEAFRLSTGS